VNSAEAASFLRVWRDGEMVIDRIAVATGFWRRALGLMGRREVPAEWGAGLVFPGCRSLQTCFMRFPLDVLFLDAEGRVVEERRNVLPWRMIAGPSETEQCLEVRAGWMPPLKGACLRLEPLRIGFDENP